MNPVRVDHTDRATAAALVAVQHAAYRVEADLTGITAIPPMHETPDDLAARRDLTVLACYDGPDPVALIGYSRGRREVAIDRLAVSPSHFRRGLARSLLGTVHGYERDARLFDVSTGKGNQPAAALYRSMGYRSTGFREVEPGLWIERFRRVVA